MRILEIITPSRLGGAERYVGWLSQEFINQGHEVLIGLRECEPVHSFYASLGLEVRHLSISGKLNPFAKSRVLTLIKEFSPDVVHTHLSTACTWGLKAAADVGVRGFGHMHSFNSVGPYRAAHRVITVSDAVGKHLAESGFDPTVVSTVYPSSLIDTSMPADDVAALGKPVVACASRLRNDKGIGDLIEAFRTVAKEIPEATLVLCGDGPMRKELENSTRTLKVVFTGYRDDVPSVLAAASLAVLPSIRPEGYGMTLFEAQAVGTPVVATNVGGAVEAMADGKTGMLVPPSSPSLLAEAIIGLLKDHERRAAMSAAAVEFVAGRSIKHSAQQVLNLFD